MTKDEFIVTAAVLKMLPFKASYYWLEQQERLGKFPAAIRVSKRKPLYRRSEVLAWIARTFGDTGNKNEKPSRAPQRAAKRTRVRV